MSIHLFILLDILGISEDYSVGTIIAVFFRHYQPHKGLGHVEKDLPNCFCRDLRLKKDFISMLFNHPR